MSDSDRLTLEQLRKDIKMHDHYYYFFDNPKISDLEYDRLM